jgi:hypothetical protein
MHVHQRLHAIIILHHPGILRRRVLFQCPVIVITGINPTMVMVPRHTARDNSRFHHRQRMMLPSETSSHMATRRDKGHLEAEFFHKTIDCYDSALRII